MLNEEWVKVKGKEYTCVNSEYESFRNRIIGTSGNMCDYKSIEWKD